MKIDNGLSRRKYAEVPEVDLEGMDLDFLGNPLKVGDTVILPYKSDNNGRTILSIGIIKEKHIDETTGMTLFTLSSNITSNKLSRLSTALIKVNVKQKEEKGTL